MIADFACDETKQIYLGRYARRLPNQIHRTARRKLLYLDEALDINDLRSPPGNRLEQIHGDREGQWSIRINEQWRLCFVWNGHNASSVEIIDYH
jgi:proteic killer suppression protein|tara:strand:+ start:621 stop:902 length:282 start_codon:yes stop_codon:yes gene_type:complete